MLPRGANAMRVVKCQIISLEAELGGSVFRNERIIILGSFLHRHMQEAGLHGWYLCDWWVPQMPGFDEGGRTTSRFVALRMVEERC